ncbi:MAG: YjjG family noncanonical pyrimidine nucleotidase [Bacteroidales bacterium]
MQKVHRKQYRHLFFDLDRTLWDYDANSREAFRDLLPSYLPGKEVDPDHFFRLFNLHNEHLWGEYRRFNISKDFLRTERFKRVFEEYGIQDEKLASRMNDDYLRVAPQKKALVPDAKDVIAELSEKYELYIITNGFTEVQLIKLKESGLSPFFKKVFTSDMAGETKPSSAIFHFALTSVQARKTESLMIGDDLEVDVMGARNYGIDQVYYNPGGLVHHEAVSYEIRSLAELRNIL